MSEDDEADASGGPGALGPHWQAAGGRPPGPLAAAAMLQAALPDRGIISSRIKAVDQGTAMLVAGERIVLCRDGCFWWAAGRFREGRTVVAIHDAADPAGAARRLAGLEKGRR